MIDRESAPRAARTGRIDALDEKGAPDFLGAPFSHVGAVRGDNGRMHQDQHARGATTASLFLVVCTVLLTACNTRSLPKSLFITPKRYVNAHFLADKPHRVVKRLDLVMRIGRIHLEGPVSINYSTEFEVNKRIDHELGQVGADYITDVEMTYMELVLPRGVTIAVPFRIGSRRFLNGWVGIPIFGVYPHLAVIHVTGEMIAIDDEPEHRQDHEAEDGPPVETPRPQPTE